MSITTSANFNDWNDKLWQQIAEIAALDTLPPPPGTENAPEEIEITAFATWQELARAIAFWTAVAGLNLAAMFSIGWGVWQASGWLFGWGW